ncbi:MAG: asparagine synthetase B family protein, partial [Gaiellaceae bacterium]
ALDCFLAANSIPAPLTIFDGVRKLPPGQLLLWEDGEARLERFARPGPVRADELRTNEDPELIEELRGRLRDSVRAHLAGDVPVGALLSGGLDSALLAALAAEVSSEPLRTFSIGFAGRSVDELAGARLVAERYGTRHRELVVRPDVALLLPALADAFDEPCADPSALPTYLVSRLAAEDVKVALSGAGGDELFGSYAAPAAKEVFSREALTELTGRTASGAELHARPQDVDPGLQLVDDLLVKTDRASTAHSLEARVPFLDTVVTNLAFALPTRHQVRGLRRPVLLRRAAEPLLPRRIVHGRKRRFSVPAAEWLRGELEPFVRATLSAGTLRRQGFFRPEAVTRLVDEHVAGAAHRGHRLWALLAFTLWYERHVEGDPGTAELPEALVERSA